MRQHVMSASRGFCRWSILQLPHIREYGTRLSRLGYDVCIRTLCINAVVLLCINQCVGGFPVGRCKGQVCGEEMKKRRLW